MIVETLTSEQVQAVVENDEKRRRDRFVAFHEAHPEIYDALVGEARTMKQMGFEKYSMRTLWEIMRWHRDVTGTKEKEGYKLNDHYPPFYARLIMHREPDLKGFFETRS